MFAISADVVMYNRSIAWYWLLILINKKSVWFFTQDSVNLIWIKTMMNFFRRKLKQIIQETWYKLIGRAFKDRIER